jgi:hypothetical protein
MKTYEATEQAYKNGYDKGYEQGKKDARKKGRWIEEKPIEKRSICGKTGFPGWRHCPHCGADLRGEEDGK